MFLLFLIFKRDICFFFFDKFLIFNGWEIIYIWLFIIWFNFWLIINFKFKLLYFLFVVGDIWEKFLNKWFIWFRGILVFVFLIVNCIL